MIADSVVITSSMVVIAISQTSSHLKNTQRFHISDSIQELPFSFTPVEIVACGDGEEFIYIRILMKYVPNHEN